MDLQIKNHRFIVCGATSGFGLAIAQTLLAEGAFVTAVARDAEKLKALQSNLPSQTDIFPADITAPGAVKALADHVAGQPLHGLVINAGGPAAKTVAETTLEDWDTAYTTLLRWKVDISKILIPRLAQSAYGRVVYIESSAVKQPLENLVLSNSLRLAVVGFVKTYSQEVAASGVTLNIMAPGSHNTPAIERLYKKKSEQTGQPVETIRKMAAQSIPVGVLGEASDFASLAGWLLSPHARYITGQTFSVDGGMVKSTFG